MAEIGTRRRHDRRPTNPIWQLPTLEVGRARRLHMALAKGNAPHNPHAWRVYGSPAFSFLSDLTERKPPQLSLLYCTCAAFCYCLRTSCLTLAFSKRVHSS